MMAVDVRAHAEELRQSGVPFVVATVVRAARPAPAKPGDRAVIHADGTIVGFVGGDCARASVRGQAMTALKRGEPILLRIVPEDVSDVAEHEGTVTTHNPCLSGGMLEIFLEPTPVRRRLAVFGSSPIATSVADLAAFLGYDVARDPGDFRDDWIPDAVVVASHGENEVTALTTAVRHGVAYIGLVASRRRGPEVLRAIDIDENERSRIQTPAGLDINAHEPPDVAVSIIAQIISMRNAGDASTARHEVAGTAIDPVCGMTVATVDATPHADVDGTRYWFCAVGCRDTFTASHSAPATA